MGEAKRTSSQGELEEIAGRLGIEACNATDGDRRTFLTRTQVSGPA